MLSLSVKMLTSVGKGGARGMFGVGQSMGQARDEVRTLTQMATDFSGNVPLRALPDLEGWTNDSVV